jgi:hypothetical protein
MDSSVEDRRRQTVDLLEKTRLETRSLLSQLDPERVVHADERAWRARDVLGHLGVWNGEAARSLSAYAAGGEYHCIPSAEYYDYNGRAADERRIWPMKRVWAEYEKSHDQLKLLVETMPSEKWEGDMLYPWHERGTVEGLIRTMMNHERIDHCDNILRTSSE